MKKSLIAILLIAITVFAFVSCKQEAPAVSNAANNASIKIADDGYIRVSFDVAQPVKTFEASYDGKTLVKYSATSDAYPVINGFEAVSAFSDYINLLSLVATDDTNKNFALALTSDGYIMNVLGAILDQVADIVGEDIRIEYGNKFEYTTEGGALLIKVPSDGLPLYVGGSLSLDFDNWDGFVLAPIYLTDDILGFLSFIASYDTKSIAPFTEVDVYYHTNGNKACGQNFVKTDASAALDYQFYEETVSAIGFYTLASGKPYSKVAVDSLAGTNYSKGLVCAKEVKKDDYVYYYGSVDAGWKFSTREDWVANNLSSNPSPLYVREKAKADGCIYLLNKKSDGTGLMYEKATLEQVLVALDKYCANFGTYFTYVDIKASEVETNHLYSASKIVFTNLDEDTTYYVGFSVTDNFISLVEVNSTDNIISLMEEGDGDPRHFDSDIYILAKKAGQLSGITWIDYYSAPTTP